MGLEEVDSGQAYRLPRGQRITRIAALFDGLARLEGGAKLALHYTDVAPALLVMAVTRGGNHMFGHVVGASGRGLPEMKIDALGEALTVFENDLLSDVYVGWVQGYLDEERAKLDAFVESDKAKALAKAIRIQHPRDALRAFVADLWRPENASWLD